jgi:hypothetical protein
VVQLPQSHPVLSHAHGRGAGRMGSLRNRGQAPEQGPWKGGELVRFRCLCFGEHPAGRCRGHSCGSASSHAVSECSGQLPLEKPGPRSRAHSLGTNPGGDPLRPLGLSGEAFAQGLSGLLQAPGLCGWDHGNPCPFGDSGRDEGRGERKGRKAGRREVGLRSGGGRSLRGRGNGISFNPAHPPLQGIKIKGKGLQAHPDLTPAPSPGGRGE